MASVRESIAMSTRPSDQNTGHVQSRLTRWVAAQTVILLLFAPYLANLCDDFARFSRLWTLRDALVLMMCMVGIAVVSVLVDEGLVRLNRPGLVRLYRHLFVLALGGGLLANLCFYTARPVGYRIDRLGPEAATAWLILFALVGYSLSRPHGWLLPAARRLALIVSPACLFVAIRLLSLNGYPSPSDRFHTPPDIQPTKPVDSSIEQLSAVATRPARPVYASASTKSVPVSSSIPIYCFIFDEWSYPRTFRDGQIRPEFAHLSRLARESLVFHDAHSPWGATERSMPNFLFQTSLSVHREGGRVGFVTQGRSADSQQQNSLFRLFDGRGYRTMMVGFFLPYKLWLTGQVDVCRTYCWLPMGEGVVGRAGMHLLNAMNHWTDPWSRFVFEKEISARRWDHAVGVHQHLWSDVRHVLQAEPCNTLAVFHYPLPHTPNIFAPDGTLLSPRATGWSMNDAVGYERNLLFLDHRIGELVRILEDAGRYDDALLILTSDHSWRYDPARAPESGEGAYTHVPLLIKLPKQKARGPISVRMDTCHLGLLIRCILDNNSDPAELVQRLESGTTIADRLVPARTHGAGRGNADPCERPLNRVVRCDDGS